MHHPVKNINDKSQETIAAIATPPGRGGIGIVRVSGPKALTIANTITGKILTPRIATLCSFVDAKNSVMDQGLVLYFKAPLSFTGEDVIEFQGHGGPVILDNLLQRILSLGARIARPGEFSERAFLNGKLDLAQAEAIADLIDASSEQAAKAAMRSLQGEFSRAIQQLVAALIYLRMYVEAAIDFPEEEIDFLGDSKIRDELLKIIEAVKSLLGSAKQGILLREGMTVVIAGRPNAGKSSLLNRLSGRESAIVTDIPGTTRDVLREHIHIDGMPFHIIDTAGLRQSVDAVEEEGVRRALKEIAQADRVLLVVDSQTTPLSEIKNVCADLLKDMPSKLPVTVVRNKIDLTGESPGVTQQDSLCIITLSAKTDEGIALLREHLKSVMGYEQVEEGNFIARRRHLDALEKAHQLLLTGQMQLSQHRAGELLAEDLRQAQNALSEITGEFTSDDLLGHIFSSFCIGK